MLRGVTLASRFLLLLVIAKFLTSTELGLFGIMAAALAFALLAMGLEFYAFSMRELMSATDTCRVAMLRDNLVLFLCGYAILAPVLIPVFMLGFMPTELLPWFFTLAVAEHISHESTRALTALSRPIAANLVLFVRAAAWIYGLFVFFWVTERHIALDSVFAWWLGGAIASLAIVAFVLRDMPWQSVRQTPVNWAWILQGLRAARPFVITAASGLGLSYFDRFVLNAFSGPSAVGVLTFFSGVAASTHMIVNASIAHVRLPRLVGAWKSGDQADYQREISGLGKATLLWITPIAALAAVAIYPVVAWIGRSEYQETLGAYFVILIASVIRCTADIPLYGLYAQHRDQALLWVNLAAFLTSLSGNLLLVPHLGVFGCAVSAVGGALVLGVAAGCVVRRGRGPSDQSG